MIELLPHDIAHGGEAVARRDGKTYFIAGAMPGERVGANVVQDKGNWARAELERILDPAPERIDPPCPHFSACGGCRWQYADHHAQLRWKRGIVAGQLTHLGGVAEPVVRDTVAGGAPYGYRNRMDFRVLDGKPALHQAKSHRLVPLDVCLLLDPDLRSVFDALGPLDEVERVTLRVGTRTGERLVVVTGQVPPQAGDWAAQVAVVRGSRVEPARGRAAITEEIAGRRFRISGLTFFQGNSTGAERLVELATEAAEVGVDDVLLDGYSGGGLFAATVGAAARRVVAVETGREAVKDLKHNLRSAAVEATVLEADFAEVPNRVDEPWTVAVVDPPRRGLGADGVDAVTAAMPGRIVYVSCDPASLARDTRALVTAGYRLDWAAPVDMFPQTHHVETVARYVRSETRPDPD